MSMSVDMHPRTAVEIIKKAVEKRMANGPGIEDPLSRALVALVTAYEMQLDELSRLQNEEKYRQADLKTCCFCGKDIGDKSTVHRTCAVHKITQLKAELTRLREAERWVPDVKSALSELDEWVKATGCIVEGTSWHSELLGLFERHLTLPAGPEEGVPHD